MNGTTSAVAARVLHVPAGRIRKWVHREKVHRYPDGTLDERCVALRAIWDELTPEERASRHAEMCHTGILMK